MAVSNAYPYITLQLSVGSYSLSFDAYVDSGFEGHVIVPANLAENFGMPLLVSTWVLADGKAIHAPEYLGRVAVPDIDFEAVVRVACLGEEFLLGRGILDRLRVTFDCGRRLAVERCSSQ